jgi:Carboxypeptidase regulatory-like domain
MKRAILFVLFLVCIASSAQETRGTLTGRVADSTGAIIPNAAITVTNTATGTVTRVVSNSAGEYTVPFLNPGPYSVAVTVGGFKNYVHSGIAIQTGQTITENVKLAIGTSDQSVTVTAEAPLLDTATANTGQVLTSEEVVDLPSNGRSPLGFARDEYGAVAKGKHSQSQTRPFDNSAADDFSLGGGNSSSNELLLNGVPNMQDSSRLAGYSPQLDSVDAIRVDEFSANASTGDTSGGTVNITTKGGTNQFHGSISEYYQASFLAAKPYFTPIGTNVPSTHFNQFGGTIGGPIWIPKVFDGRNKLFFFYAYEGYVSKTPLTTIASVPTQAERNGDFSALLALGTKYQLYNPYTATLSGSTITRTAIPGNVLANAGLTVSPITQNYMKYIPLPNYTGPTTTADGQNNYFINDPTSNNYHSQAGRIDYNIVPSNKIFAELHYSDSITGQSNVYNNISTGTNGNVVLWGGSVEDVQNFSPTLNLDTRLGFSRSVNSSTPNSIGVNPTSLGYPSYVASNSSDLYMPRLTFSDLGNSNLIPSISSAPGNSAAFDTYQFFASVNKSWGHHTIKIGPDIRLNKDSVLSPGNASGTYAFSASGTDFVSAGTSGSDSFGNAFALFDLGLATGGSLDINTKFQYSNWYSAIFAQDDWKVAPNFTISMGLRLEHETAPVESQNRITTGWDPTIVNAATAAATKAYAAAPLPNGLLPASQFVATGGVNYATPTNRTAYSTAALYVSPRLGMAYSPDNGKTAIRAGFGIYDNPFNDYNTSQTYGFSQTTNLIATNNNNLTPATTYADPFPTASNPIQQPLGNALGINTNLGNKMVYYANVKVAYSERASLDIQHQFGKSWLLDVGYVFNHQVHQSYSNAVNGGSGTVPVSYLSRSAYYDPVLNPLYAGSTPNPFKGTFVVGPTSSLNTASTVAVSALLNPYAEYSSVTQQLIPGGSANFNALLVRIEKRMSYGLQFNLNYEHSRNLGAQSQLNSGGALWYGETASDFPDHVALTAIYLLPFGQGRPFLSNSSKLVNEFIGGWTVSSIYSFLSGTPYGWGNVIYTGTNFKDFNNHPHQTTGVFNTSVFDTRTQVSSTNSTPVQPTSYNYRTFPLMALRSDVTNNWDFSLLKNFQIYDRVQIQPRVDAFNAFNRVQFAAPNLSPTSSAFGTINSQQNSGRQLQGGVHIIF